ncbi:MAG: hypothetical protein PHU45_02770 [Bacilli bacterium]|nr:hypothetical protein [Bacilli bacterium]
MEINPRFTALICLFGIIGLVMFPSQIFGFILSPYNAWTKNNEEINTITDILRENPQMVKNIQEHPEVVNALKNDNYTPIIKKEAVYITITPTPDGKTYYAGEYQEGVRLLAHPFSWYRKDVNIPDNNLKVSANVYDFRIFPKYHYKNLEYSDSPNGIYDEQLPYDNNDEFIFIFANIYGDEVISDKTNNVWLPTQKCFSIAIEGTTYYPIVYPYQLKIKEMQELTNQQNSYFIQPYGYTVQYEEGHSRHNELYNNGTPVGYESSGIAGITARSLSYIPKGESNMVDGYLLFEIPKDTKIEDITVLGSFFSFGQAQWKLYNQNSKDFVNPYITPTQY